MNICIAGSSGFIGRNLVTFLNRKDYIVTRILRKDFVNGCLASKLLNQEVIINLSGENLSGRWSSRKRRAIYESRINTTRSIVEAINSYNTSVKTIVSISAVGIYDNVNIHDESSVNYARNFLARVIFDWEKEVTKIVNRDIRVVTLRMGIVLGKDGGLLEKIKNAFNIGIEIKINKNHAFPFVHIDDVMKIFDLAISNENLTGIINVVSPQRIGINDFFAYLFGRKRILFSITMNEFLLKLFLGEGSIVINEGQDVIPKKLLSYGYDFSFPNIESVIDDLMI